MSFIDLLVEMLAPACQTPDDEVRVGAKLGRSKGPITFASRCTTPLPRVELMDAVRPPELASSMWTNWKHNGRRNLRLAVPACRRSRRTIDAGARA